MLNLNISKRSEKFLRKVPSKHAKQLTLRVSSLIHNPLPHDFAHLKGNLANYLRIDSGEYRIIYRVSEQTLFVVLIAKRNDDEVYRKMERLI